MNALFRRLTGDSAGYRDITPDEVARRLSPTPGPGAGSGAPSLRVVDVREPAELIGDLGHIPGVEPVPLQTLERASQTWDKDREIVLVCRSGARSARAAALLAAAGFRRVMNLTGGMIAWNEAGLPTERGGP